ncbi:CRISPR-associated protein Cas2 [Liquorilactobacillus sucicola DSM 21376 = JCM 15457]|uniref:CRISPR-associated endonuclease Cas2 n=1 Tax=Liquorilactobacillus sucicola TaxID=519050 RepID=UPI0004360587|nr:CRISPR-associated endonuclease Cas2 [Liquorilactobacillus sucicola]GAJ25649.1 CRISPR-associated protein Cas2 [Liquorilactobacillus sucicola DSM 21376 = JCM 15457]
MYVILVYDIAADKRGARVSRRVFKICKKFLTHVQKSVFEGQLSVSQLKQLTTELNQWIRDDRDSVILFKNRNKTWLIKEFIGMDKSEDTSNIF